MMENLGILFLTLFQPLLLFFSPTPPPLVSPVWGTEFSGEIRERVYDTGAIETYERATDSAGLREAVMGALKDSSGEYHVFVKFLPTGEMFAMDENKVMSSGSLYKAWLAVGILEEIRQGKLRDDKVLSEPIEELNKWAGLDPAEAEITEGVATFTVSEALKQMIGVSHNYAAYLLTQQIENKKVQAMLKEHKLFDSHYSRPPTVSVKDMALFFEKVYRNEFFPDETSQTLKDLFAGNKLNDAIPRFLPAGTRVEHKTGEIGRFKHDCGIVYSKGGDYVICIMSQSGNPEGAEERIAHVSKAVYDYFHRKLNHY